MSQRDSSTFDRQELTAFMRANDIDPTSVEWPKSIRSDGDVERWSVHSVETWLWRLTGRRVGVSFGRTSLR